MSRWTQSRQYEELIRIRNHIEDAKEGVSGEQFQDLRAARESVRVTLGSHGLFTASFAMSRDVYGQSYVEFQKMVNRIKAGGYHATRARLGNQVPE